MIPKAIYISPIAFDRFLDRVKDGEFEFLKDRPFALSWEREGVSETSDALYLVGWKMEAKPRRRMIQLADSDGRCCTTIYDTLTEASE